MFLAQFIPALELRLPSPALPLFLLSLTLPFKLSLLSGTLPLALVLLSPALPPELVFLSPALPLALVLLPPALPLSLLPDDLRLLAKNANGVEDFLLLDVLSLPESLFLFFLHPLSSSSSSVADAASVPGVESRRSR